MSKEVKFVGGRVVEFKEEERNGQPIGIVAGYIATWDIDRGQWGVKDQFVRGAFIESLREHVANSNRPIRLKDQHGKVIGGFPIDQVYEDNVGLFGIGEINLGFEEGKRVMALVRQGVLSDFSIGFSVVEFSEDEGLRKITKAIVWEGSVVDEPMNPFAKITQVKNYSIAEKDYEWVAEDAFNRVKAFGNYEGLPIVDVIDNELVIIPQAVFKAAVTAKSAEEIQYLEQIYAKMNIPSPFEDDKKQYFTTDDVKDWTPRDLEKALRKSGTFSKNAAKIIAGKLVGLDKSLPITQNTKNILDELRAIREIYK